MHVPKTAGSTLKWIIERQYSPSHTAVIESEDLLEQYRAFQAMPPEARGRLECVIGHVPYGVHQWLPQGARYITMLRNPVAWTLSFHNYMRSMPFFDTHPDLKVFHGVRALDLNGFVSFLEDSNMADMQTRMISGEVDVTTTLPPYMRLSEDALERAKHRLRDEFACAGLVERFDESLLLMKRRLGWRHVYYRKLNVSRDRSEPRNLPRHTLQRILACHRRDVELHDYAGALLAAQIEAEGPGFERELRRLRRLNVMYDRLVPLYEASGLLRLRRALRQAFATTD